MHACILLWNAICQVHPIQWSMFLFCFVLGLFSGSLIYEKLGEKAFGWPGKCGVFISVTMQNIGGKEQKFSNF